MNAIVGITNLMEHEAGTSEKLRDYIHKVQASSRHLLSLINDVLDMSKIESSEVTLNVDSIRLAEQVAQVDSIIRPQTNEHGQTFRIYVHEIVHEYLLGDGMRLRQIFLNLLSNAVKYTPYGGSIRFDLAELPCKQEGHASFRFSVTDNGYGMDADLVAHIFEPFTRGEDSVTNKIQGTGLGMAITKNIVDLMGGQIRVDSLPGRGSRFDVDLTFPVDPDAQYNIGVQRTLLISDDEMLVRNMSASFHLAELQFRTVRTVDEASALLAREHFELVMLSGYLQNDLLQPAIRRLRAQAKGAQLLFCVDYAQPEQVQDALIRAGADGLIQRPFFLSSLENALEHMLAKQDDEAGRNVLNGMRLLCAEDNVLNTEILRALLEMAGATCTICPDGQSVVDLFEQTEPGEFDAILMDVQMPRMNGYEATRAIRAGKNPAGKTIPIIAMTANAFSDDVRRSMAAGMDAHISKPVDMATLEKTLKSFCTPPRVRNRRTIVRED